MLDNQDQQRQDALAREERQELREERLREEACVREQEARARAERQERREECLREEAHSREERQLQDARADKERMERQAYAAAAALQQAATLNLELAKLAFLNPSEPKPPGRTPETPAKASSPHRSERDGERSQAESPPPSSKGPHFPASPAQAVCNRTGPYDALPLHPPGSIVPLFTQDCRENYREMRMSLEYLLGKPQAHHSEKQKWLTLSLHCKLPMAKRICTAHAKSLTPYTDSISEMDHRWGSYMGRRESGNCTQALQWNASSGSYLDPEKRGSAGTTPSFIPMSPLPA